MTTTTLHRASGVPNDLIVDMRCSHAAVLDPAPATDSSAGGVFFDEYGCCYHGVRTSPADAVVQMSARTIALRLASCGCAIPAHFDAWAPRVCLVCRVCATPTGPAHERIDDSDVCTPCAEALRACHGKSFPCSTSGCARISVHARHRYPKASVFACAACLVRHHNPPDAARVESVLAIAPGVPARALVHESHREY